MERFELINKEGRNLMLCPNQHLMIEVAAVKDVPAYLENDIVYIGHYQQDPIHRQDLNVVFKVHCPEMITCPQPLTHDLITAAVTAWIKEMTKGQPFDDVRFTQAYRERYLDVHHDTDPAKVPDAVKEYLQSAAFKNGIDFYDWQDAKIKAANN